ncbi:MAG: acyl-CoA dehydrogenase family protein, partial [Pannonibacter indicus]
MGMALGQKTASGAAGEDSAVEHLFAQTGEAVAALDTLLDAATRAVRAKVTDGKGLSAEAMDRHQHATHGLAWLATYVEALRQMDAYGQRLRTEGRLGRLEELTLRLGFSEYLAQVLGGIPMNQGEFIRLASLGLGEADTAALRSCSADLIAQGSSPELRAELAELIRHQEGHSIFGDSGLDETLEQIRSEMRRFAEDKVSPHAHQWHLDNDYIPLDVITQMAELGVFGLTIPEEYGGMGLGKQGMVVVSEELSRAYIGVGSLGTRSEIAAELILCGGTAAQKEKWLPKL